MAFAVGKKMFFRCKNKWSKDYILENKTWSHHKSGKINLNKFCEGWSMKNTCFISSVFSPWKVIKHNKPEEALKSKLHFSHVIPVGFFTLGENFFLYARVPKWHLTKLMDSALLNWFRVLHVLTTHRLDYLCCQCAVSIPCCNIFFSTCGPNWTQVCSHE